MLQPFQALRRAFEAVCAAAHSLAFRADGGGPAFGAAVRKDEFGAVHRPGAGDHPHHLRDHIAGPLDHHPVAHADVLAADFVLVMQRGVGHHHPADGHRFKPGHRGQGAGAAHLDVDGVQYGLGLFCRKLVRQSPPRRPRDLAQPVLIIMPVDLVDDAVDVIAEVRTRSADGSIGRQQPGHVWTSPGQRVDAETHAAKGGKALHMRVGKRRARLAKRIGEEPQVARCGHLGVLLAKRSGGRVAGIGEYLAAGGVLRRIQRQKVAPIHIELASHLKYIRR